MRKFDHHCPWIGACVGEKNHFQFWLSLLGHTVLSLFTAFIVIKQQFSFTNLWATTPIKSLMARIVQNMDLLLCFAFLWFAIFLMPVHFCFCIRIYWQLTSRPVSFWVERNAITFLMWMVILFQRVYAKIWRWQFMCKSREGSDVIT